MSCKTPDLDDINPIDRYLTPQSKDTEDSLEDYLLKLNTFRQDQGHRALVSTSYMNELAQGHAEDMASGKVPFGHQGKLERCTDVRNEVPQSKECGEVIAKGPENAEGVFSLWSSNELHREKLLNPSYTHTGVGIAEDRDGKFFWVQLFLEVI